MTLKELFNEGAVKRALDNNTYYSAAAREDKKYSLSVNGKKWGNFKTEKAAMKAAESLYMKNNRLKISVVSS